MRRGAGARALERIGELPAFISLKAACSLGSRCESGSVRTAEVRLGVVLAQGTRGFTSTVVGLFSGRLFVRWRTAVGAVAFPRMRTEWMRVMTRRVLM